MASWFQIKEIEEKLIIFFLVSAEVKLPVEMVDRIQRPQFIVRNDAGMEVCTNRASCTFVSLLVFDFDNFIDWIIFLFTYRFSSSWCCTEERWQTEI